MAQASDKKNGIAILLCALVLGLSLFLLDKYTTREIDESGVFVIAKITQRVQAKNGTDYSLNYVFNNRVYHTKFSSMPNEFLNKESLVYLKVLPNNPRKFMYVETRVPACLTLKDLPSNGWKDLPKCR
ncbi:MAG TPA: hypothetical protein VLC98_08890 [Phnomibacter sp.]|nr:hypothetical protein [Phnomibacter sp.]